MSVRSSMLGGFLVSAVAAACASTDEAPAADAVQEGNLTTGGAPASMRTVDIVVSATKTGENYEARSYPSDDMDGNGLIELYNSPVYSVFVDGVDKDGKKVRREWKSPRYMPFFNDPAAPDTDYKTRGFVTAGLSAVPRQPVPKYKPEYEVHNRFSPFGGAIVVKGTFYIHAGPADLSETGWGSAGCVEIIGNFDKFKTDIVELAGLPTTDLNKAIGQLVAARKVFVTYEQAERPNLRAARSRQVAAEEDDETETDSPQDRTTEPTE